MPTPKLRTTAKQAQRDTDQDAEGRLLAKELKVPFVKLPPKASDVQVGATPEVQQ